MASNKWIEDKSIKDRKSPMEPAEMGKKYEERLKKLQDEIQMQPHKVGMVLKSDIKESGPKMKKMKK